MLRGGLGEFGQSPMSAAIAPQHFGSSSAEGTDVLQMPQPLAKAAPSLPGCLRHPSLPRSCGELLVFDLSVAALLRRAAILLCGLLAAIVSVEGKHTKSEVFSLHAVCSWTT